MNRDTEWLDIDLGYGIVEINGKGETRSKKQTMWPLTNPDPNTNLQEIEMDRQELKTGVKKDDGKPRWELLPWDAIEEIVKVLTEGAKKYEARNWEKGISYGRVMGAGWRHDVKFWLAKQRNQSEIDHETNCHHLAESICERLFALAYELRGMKDFDDRPRN